MPAHKKGTEGYYKAREKRLKTMVERYGSIEAVHEFYQRIGKKGGVNGHTGGFASDKVGEDGLTGYERARISGARGGRKSRRGPAKKGKE